MNINHRRQAKPRKTWLDLPVILVLLIIASTSVPAQQFQFTYGNADGTGEEGNAIVASASGDYIIAGSAYTTGLAIRNMYIVRTAPDGSILWQLSNPFIASGYESEVTDIEEYPNGDLAVAGNIWTPVSGRIAVAMRLDAGGNQLWTGTIALTGLETEAHSLIITKTGEAVLAGAAHNGTPGSSDGLLACFRSDGVLHWVRTYDVAAGDDALYGVDEEQTPPYLNRANGTSKNGQTSRGLLSDGPMDDIIAVGSAVDGGNREVWVLDVSGKNGDIKGSSLYGTSYEDYGTSIRQLRYGASPGEIVVTGSSKGRPQSTGQSEVIVMQLHEDDCHEPLNVIYFGDASEEDELGLCVREITSVGTIGNIIVSGTISGIGFGGKDAFLQEFQEGTLAPVGSVQYFGDVGDEEGRSVVEAPHKLPVGYALAGSTTSTALMPSGHSRNIWFAKTDVTLSSSCFDATMSLSDAQDTWNHNCFLGTVAIPTLVTPQPSALFVRNTVSWPEHQVCYSSPKIALPQHDKGYDAAGSIGLAAHPNPIPRGNRISLAYSLAAEGNVHITITDVLGRVIYETMGQRDAGNSTETISTEGWSTGTYLVTATSSGKSATTRIVVAGH